MWDPKMTYRSIHQLRQWKNARIDPEDVPVKTAISCGISHCPCVIYQRVDPPWAAFASRGNVAARLVSFLMPGTFGMANGFFFNKSARSVGSKHRTFTQMICDHMFFFSHDHQRFMICLAQQPGWISLTLGPKKSPCRHWDPPWSAPATATAGSPSRPWCRTAPSRRAWARHAPDMGGMDEGKSTGRMSFFFWKGGRNWQNPSNVSIIFDLHNVGKLWNIWLSENGLIWIKYSELTTNVRTEVIGRNWRNHPHVPNIWGLWTKRFEDAWGILILGLNHQPVDDSYLIEKIQGIHTAETCNRVAPPLETAYDPRKIISYVWFVQTPWQDRRWRKLWTVWSKLIKTGDILWRIMTATDHCE